MTDPVQAIRDALEIWNNPRSKFTVGEQIKAVQSACNPAAITELLARLDAAESDAANARGKPDAP
jgi:hypothetical protein